MISRHSKRLSKTANIVKLDWLAKSAKAGKVLPTDKFRLLDDKAAEKQYLMMTSLKTALAIVLHNLPEGVATFIAALYDPKVGAVRKLSC